MFHGFKRRSKKKRKQFLEDIQKRGFIELTEAIRAALANGGRGQSGGTEAPSTPHDSTTSQRFDPSGNAPQSEEAVGSGHSGHGGTVSPTDGGREAGRRADAEGSVAGTGSSDSGASGRVDASEKEAILAADDLNDLLMPPVVDWAKPGLLNTPIGKLAAVFTIESLVYGNILGELAGESFAALKKGDPVKALEMALRLGAYVLTFSTMGALLMGQGPDEEEDIEDWVARQVITGLMGVDPFFLRLANAHFVQPTLFGKKSGTINVPALETIEMVSSGASDLVTQLVKAVRGEKEFDWENFSPAIDTIGPFVNAPVHVLRRFLDAHLSNKNGIDSVPVLESPLGSLEAFVYGRKKSRGWNLFRLAIEKEE